MPIINPVEVVPEFPPSVVFAGDTELSGSLTVKKTMQGTLAGATTLSGSLGGMVALSGTLAGATALDAFLRLNNEANVFLSGTLDGATELAVDMSASRGMFVSLDGATDMSGNLLVARPADFGFTFFVDIADSSVSSALSNPSNIRRFSGRLLVDGEPVPFIRANVNAPDNTLGTELSVVLLRPDVTQVTRTASIEFQLGIWAENAWQWTPLLAGGRMSSLGAHYANQDGLPADSVEVSFVDALGDRWNRRPDAPRILYDPQVLPPPTEEAISQQTIYDNTLGEAITPVYLEIAGMRLKNALEEAFVLGCGFDRVVTNIDDFSVEQVVFSLPGGYIGGVRDLIGRYEPITFVVNNDLWIVTLDNPLPAGFDARQLAAGHVQSLDDNLPGREPVNALLVSLKDGPAGAESGTASDDEFFTERLETKTERAGVFGTEGYTETDIERRVREYRKLSAPAAIVREEEAYIKTRVLDHEFNEISIETLTRNFDALNRPTGYRRVMQSYLPDLADPDGARVLQPALDERQYIFYGPHPLDPRRDTQTRIKTHTDGAILVDEDNEYLNKPYRIPLNDAHKSGYVSPGGGQSLTFGPIRSVIETLRVEGGQVMRDRHVQNHVAGVTEPPTTQVLPGDAGLDRQGPAALRSGQSTRLVLLTVPGSEGAERVVQEFDASGLPADLGMQLAEKRLARLNNPPRELAVEMAFVDPTVRRGTDLLVMGRAGSVGTFIVRGYSITVEKQADGAVLAKMSLRARELQT